MNVILKRDPVWLESLPSPHASPSLLLLGGDGVQVAVPAPLLLAASPLVRSFLTGLLPPAYGLCFLSLPAVTGEVLHVVVDILTTGKVVGEHEDNIEDVKEVFGMLGIDALLVSCHVESIQVGQVLDGDIKVEHYSEGSDVSLDEENIIKAEVIVKTEDTESTNVKESKMLGQSPCLKNSIRKSFSCNLCMQKFTSNNVLKRHIKSVHDDLEACHLCPQKFSSEEDLVTHMKAVHHKSEISCNICFKNFMRNETLVRHLKSVHRKIEVSCHLCPKKFTLNKHLVRHIKIIHDQIKIPCNLCPKKFTQKEYLMAHIRIVHEQSKIVCDLCPQMFTAKKGLKLHIESIHYLIKYPCNLCSKKFTQKSHLVRHIKSVHNQIKDSLKSLPTQVLANQSLIKSFPSKD